MRQLPVGGEHYNANAASDPCLRAVLAAGLYPNVVRVVPPEAAPSSRPHYAGRARAPQIEGPSGLAVAVHPSSINASGGDLRSRWLVYYEKVRTSQVFVRDSTMVTPYPLLLFGGELKVQHAQQTIAVDGWIEFSAPPRVAVLFKQLRAELDKLLLAKIETPELDLPLTGRTIGTIVELLQQEVHHRDG